MPKPRHATPNQSGALPNNPRADTLFYGAPKTKIIVKTCKKKLKPVPVKHRALAHPADFMPATEHHPAPTPEATPATAIAALESALAAVRDLSAQRARAKLSVARLLGVARELKELLKVMTVYGV